MADLRSLLPAMTCGFAVAAVCGYIVAASQPSIYEAHVSLTESSTTQRLRADPVAGQAAQQRLAFYGEIATNGPTLTIVGDRFGFGASDLRKRVRTHTTSDGAVLEIVVRDRQPDRAAAVANAIAVELTNEITQEVSMRPTLSREVDSDLASRVERYEEIAALTERLRSRDELTARAARRLADLESGLGNVVSTYTQLVQFSESAQADQLSIISPASTPRSAIAPTPAVDAMLAGLLGALLAMPLGLIPHFLDRKVRRAADVLEETGLATLAVVPRVPGDRLRPTLARDAVLAAPRSDAAEAYRTLRWVCDSSWIGSHTRLILVAGPSRSDGAATTALNLAIAFAQVGRHVALVDADLDHPRVHRLMRMPNGRGLAEALMDQATDVDAPLAGTPQAKLHLLTAGDAVRNPAGHIGSARMRAVLGRLKSDHDVVVLVCPPETSSSAAAILGPMADAVIVVADAGRTSRVQLRAAAASFARWSRLLGVTLVHPPGRIASRVADLLPPRPPRTLGTDGGLTDPTNLPADRSTPLRGHPSGTERGAHP